MKEHINKNKMVMMVAGAVIIAGISFFAGIKYDAEKQLSSASGQGGYQGAAGAARTGRNLANLASGEMLSMDDESMTVKLRDGGSRIVFFSGSTQIMKSVAGTASDLKAGDQVSAMGSANTDGSITAESVQIRPARVADTKNY